MNPIPIRYFPSPARGGYRNPANPHQVWHGRGRRPRWLANLVDELGGLPPTAPLATANTASPEAEFPV